MKNPDYDCAFDWDCEDCPARYVDKLVRAYEDAGITERVWCEGYNKNINSSGYID